VTPEPAEDESWGNSGPVAPQYGDLGDAGSEDWVIFDLFRQGCGESDSHWEQTPEMWVEPIHMCVSAKRSTLLEEVFFKEEVNKDMGRVVSLGGMQKGLTAKQEAGNSKDPSVSEDLPIVETWRSRNRKLKLHHQQRMHNQAPSQSFAAYLEWFVLDGACCQGEYSYRRLSAALHSLDCDSKNAFKLSMCKSTVAVYQDIPILKCEG